MKLSMVQSMTSARILRKSGRLTSLGEHEVVLSLARLITAGRVTRLPKEDKEIYVRVKRLRTLREKASSYLRRMPKTQS